MKKFSDEDIVTVKGILITEFILLCLIIFLIVLIMIKVG